MKAALKNITLFSVLMLYLVSATGIVITYTDCCCYNKSAIEFNKANEQSCPVCEMNTAKETDQEGTIGISDPSLDHCCSHTYLYIKDFSQYSNSVFKPVVKTTFFYPVTARIIAPINNIHLVGITDYSLKDPPRPSGKALLQLLCNFKYAPDLA